MNYQLTLAVVGNDDILLCNIDRQLKPGWWVLYWDKKPDTGFQFKEAIVLGCVAGGWPSLPTMDYAISLPAQPAREDLWFGTIWTDTTKYDLPFCYGLDGRSRLVYHGYREEVERLMRESFTENFFDRAEKEFS